MNTNHAATTRAVAHVLATRGPQAGAALRRAIRADRREHLDAALAELVDAGRVTATRTAKGTRYTLRPSPDPARVPNSRRWCEDCGVRRRRATGRLCGHCLSEINRQENR